jgi:hypothetical protein
MSHERFPTKTLAAGRALMLPCLMSLALLALTQAPRVAVNPRLVSSFLGAAGLLLVWSAALYLAARRVERRLTVQLAVRRHHWVQACAQGAVLLYWGWYVRAVYAYLPLIAAQLIFAYAVDSLLSWSRRDTYQLGLGPFPIILSINLFLWFKDDWFHWQFAMVVVGYLAKELIRWTKENRSAHIFNPSSFPLAVFSLVLILTGTTDITWGLEIAATQYNPPHIYAVIFLAALPGQLLFGVATMTMSAVIAAYTFSVAYLLATGTYYFYDSYIPIAVFLGMHLLFTDPSTSPRTESGRIAFGVLYGLGTVWLYWLLNVVGVPTFYDKLLPVPIMNLMVRAIDRAAVSERLRLPPLASLGSVVTSTRRRLATVATWIFAFSVIHWAGGVGDDHPGQYLPFWVEACADGSARACDAVAVRERTYCERGSAWACNELGITMALRASDRSSAMNLFERACTLEFTAGCDNALRLRTGEQTLAEGDPSLVDLPIVLRGSKGPVTEQSPGALYALACARGWTDMCGALAGEGGA